MRAGSRAAGVLVALIGLARPGSVAAAEPWAVLVGRVSERGARRGLAGVRVQTAGGASAVTDGDGRFQIALPPGRVELVVVDEAHEPLRATAILPAGRATLVEYRLLRHAARYTTTIAGEPRHEGERRSVEGEEVRSLAGALGDPVRAVAMLPGVALPYPLAPVLVVRGAPPGTTGFFLDGVPVPQLFHLLVGDGLIHPDLAARTDLYPSGFGASFGRYAGGIIDAETRSAQPQGLHAIADLRLYEASALVEAELPREARAVVAGRYGFPNWLLHRFDPLADLTYWDYQLRVDRRGLTLEAFGAWDGVSTGGPSPRAFHLTFHRAQIRERERVAGVDIEAALWGGVDEMSAYTGWGVRKLAAGLRGSVRKRWRRFRLAAGLDGEVSRFTPNDFSDPANGMSATLQDEYGELGSSRTGVVAGGFAEGGVEIVPGLAATVGGRLDVYHASGVTLVGLDPRLGLRARLLRRLGLRAAFGLHQQPPSFPVGLPGLDTFALPLGLQRAWQASVAIETELPGGIAASLSGYYHRYEQLTDVIVAFEPPACALPPPEALDGLSARILRQVPGQSYGAELLARRQAGRFTGWIAYTLSRSERRYPCGWRPSDFDQTHLLHLVAQARLPWRLGAGAHFLYSSGRPGTVPDAADPLSTLRNNARLPDYLQLDLRIDREWVFDGWTLAASIEVLNVTYSRTVFEFVYPRGADPRTQVLGPPKSAGWNWVLPSVGLRARF